MKKRRFEVFTIKGVAEKLDGVEYGREVDMFHHLKLRDAGIVVVFGASDDLMEFRGAIDDEVDCYDGGVVHVGKNGKLVEFCDDCGGDSNLCPYYRKEIAEAWKIEALWCEENDCSWSYRTDIPHETFRVMEGGEVYCVGIVFDLSLLKK